MDTRYDEALERARAGMPIDEVFPELKESEDEKIRKELLEEIEFIIPHDDETDSEGLILPSYHARIDRYKSYLERQKEQQPAGWSMEDKDYYDAIIGKLEVTQDDAMLTDNQMDFLKSLPERFNLQPKQEWSEEDEKNLELVTDCIYEFYPDPVMKYKLKDWLKSLRPHPHWKPSEKQVRALEQWLRDNQYKGDSRYIYPIFSSLYNDLKKLLNL